MWKSCRKQEKTLRGIMAGARKRAERRKEYYLARFSDPLQELRISNCGVEIIQDSTLWRKIEEGQTFMMPWSGDTGKMVDKYDGRALLADIPNWGPTKKVMTEEESDLESSLNFERYRDLIEGHRHGTDCATVLQNVKDSVIGERKFAPTQRDVPKKDSLPLRDKPLQPRGRAQFGASKFDYETNTAIEQHYSSASSDEDDEVATGIQDLLEEVPDSQEAQVNDFARKYAIDDYCRLVRKENRTILSEHKRTIEADTKGRGKLTRRERRKLRDKLNRQSRHSGRESPSYDPYKPRGHSSRSRSRSPRSGHRSSTTTSGKFITEFSLEKKDESYSDSSDSSGEEVEIEKPADPPSPSTQIKEATEINDITNAILRKPGDRWNFARAIDEKFNQPRYKSKFDKGRLYNSSSLPRDKNKEKETKKMVSIVFSKQKSG
eukprot:TRINITY_DN4600_c0_g1_i8.p1 TRINITY_DN4600_c0_g1~~TRINITY_DN4600_c0_g1_i8.p1  ORF type:complete len:434 (-),score=76.15 TRINITY_DN4600_c0_g1_i8:650-1951(-)